MIFITVCYSISTPSPHMPPLQSRATRASNQILPPSPPQNYFYPHTLRLGRPALHPAFTVTFGLLSIRLLVLSLLLAAVCRNMISYCDQNKAGLGFTVSFQNTRREFSPKSNERSVQERLLMQILLHPGAEFRAFRSFLGVLSK